MTTDDTLSRALDVFLTVLRMGWPAVATLAPPFDQGIAPTMLADWAQSNWEHIVEAAFAPEDRIRLEIYGDGADNGVSSRIWEPEAIPTHAVHCKPRAGTVALDLIETEEIEFPEEGFMLDRFVARTNGGWYDEDAPFDHLLVSVPGREYMFRNDEMRFFLVEV